MDIRETSEYKNMTPFVACAIVERISGFERSTDKLFLAAWQYIADKEMTLWLQGAYGRVVEMLIEKGIIQKPLTND